MSAEYPGAQWAAIPGFGFPTGTHGQNQPRFIILHGTASGDGTAQQQVAYFQGDNQHGVHFVIGKDGAVFQMVALADAAYGNCCVDPAPAHALFWDTILQSFPNLNCCTISIEHCKIAADNSDVLTPAQQAASFALVAWLCKTLNIPARDADVNGGITGHFSLNGINRINCPGVYPWQALWQYLKPPLRGARMIIKHPTDPLRYDFAYVSGGAVIRHVGHNPDELAAGTQGKDDWLAPASVTLVSNSLSMYWTPDGTILGILVADTTGQLWHKSMFDGGKISTDWQVLATEDVEPVAGPAPTDPLAQKIEAALLAAAHSLEAGLA